MAKIVDPDQILDGVEVVYNTLTLEVEYLIAGNLNDNSPGKTSGVAMQAAYSASKDHWLASAALRLFRTPYDAVFNESFTVKDGWDFANVQTVQLLRDAGVKIAATGQEFACIVGLQSTGASDQLYFQQVAGFTSPIAFFDKTGDLNELIEIYDGAANDRRDFLKVFNRVQGKTYAEGNVLADQGGAALTFVAYKLPLGTTNDPNITHTDTIIDTTPPYTGMSVSFLIGSGFTTWADGITYPAGGVIFDPLIQAGGSTAGTWWFTPAGGTSNGTGTADDIGVTDWETFAGERFIAGEWYAFNRVIAGNTGDGVQVTEWAKRIERLPSDINADTVGAPNQNGFGPVNGEVCRRLAAYSGGLITFPGVYIDDLDDGARVLAKFADITVDGGGLDSESVPFTSNLRAFPFGAAGVLSFSENLTDEPDGETIYTMFHAYTRRDSDVDVDITSAVGNTAILGSANIDLSIYSAGDWVSIGGFSAAVNNGLFEVIGIPTANTLDIKKTREPLTVLINEIAGPAVTIDAAPFDTVDAIVVDDFDGVPIQGQIVAPTESFSFAYDTNTQGGRTSGIAAPVVVVAQALDGAKWVEDEFEITRTLSLNFPVDALDEFIYTP